MWRQNSDNTGKLVFYGWADPNNYSTQTISMINGLRITISEPASIMLMGLGLLGLVGLCRRHA